MREIKFKSVFEEYGNGKLSVTTDTWGVIEGGFSSPSSRSGAKRINELQYTGLKDNNGKEIYEGDYVNCNRYDNGENYLVEIKDIRYLPSELFGSNLNYREVIGNIYENPELLTP